jgi:hypothetical protein
MTTTMMKEGRERSKHTYTGETPSAFFKQHQSRERERQKRTQFTQSFIKQREEEKSGYFDKNLLELVKRREKNA